MKKIRLGIIGATGYVGLDLVRILSNHPGFELTTLASQSYAGKVFSDIYPAFRKIADHICTDTNPENFVDKCDVVITALPHGVSSEIVPKLLSMGLRVLDHSGDFRYKDASVYERAYKMKHPCPELLEESVYGLPEIYRQQIKSARLVANPGCYPTCSLLAINPLLVEKIIDPKSIIISAVSGISGAGRKADLAYQFCESESTFRPYSVSGHRHISEIESILSERSGENVVITFTPHLAPMKRGMLATIHAKPIQNITDDDLMSIYNKYYDGEYFVRLLPKGELPDTRNVSYSNFADISFTIDHRSNQIKIYSAIDNLGKGASLQAIQALNIMYQFPEETALCITGSGI